MRNYFEEMNIDYDELKSYEEIETYYDEVKDYSNLIQELQCDRVEALKQIVNKNKEIERLTEKNEELRALYYSEGEVKEDYKSKVNKALEYIEEQKPLSVDETRQKEQLKLAYKNSDIFKTICHLEDLEIAIWELKAILKGVDKE